MPLVICLYNDIRLFGHDREMYFMVIYLKFFLICVNLNLCILLLYPLLYQTCNTKYRSFPFEKYCCTDVSDHTEVKWEHRNVVTDSVGFFFF